MEDRINSKKDNNLLQQGHEINVCETIIDCTSNSLIVNKIKN